MSSRKRTNKNPKGFGYDYWSRRVGNSGMQGYGPNVKTRTHRLERRIEAKSEIERSRNEEV